MSKLSNEEYYHGAGVSISVPFEWESQPGTPKVKFRENYPLPPLTPPPSFCDTPARKPIRKPSKTNLISNIFSKHNGSTSSSSKRIVLVQPSPAFSSPSSSSSFSSHSSSPRSRSSCSVPSSPITPLKFRERSRSMSNSQRLAVGKYDDEEYDSLPVSTFCFGCARGANNARCSRGLYSSFIKVFLRDF